jgi:prevent-host-death family protein
MTKLVKTAKKSARGRSRVWALADAKANLSEVVRRAREDGPQRLTVHGKSAAIVVSVEQFEKLSESPAKQSLVDFLRDSPLRHVEFGRESFHTVFRHRDEL